jgi:hypothetical protein
MSVRFSVCLSYGHLGDVFEAGIPMEMLVRVGAQPRLPSQLRGRTVAVKQPEKRWSRAVPCARRGARRCLTATAGCATTQSGTWLKWRVPSVRIAPECATRMRAGQLRQAPLRPA